LTTSITNGSSLCASAGLASGFRARAATRPSPPRLCPARTIEWPRLWGRYQAVMEHFLETERSVNDRLPGRFSRPGTGATGRDPAMLARAPAALPAAPLRRHHLRRPLSAATVEPLQCDRRHHAPRTGVPAARGGGGGLRPRRLATAMPSSRADRSRSGCLRSVSERTGYPDARCSSLDADLEGDSSASDSINSEWRSRRDAQPDGRELPDGASDQRRRSSRRRAAPCGQVIAVLEAVLAPGRRRQRPDANRRGSPTRRHGGNRDRWQGNAPF
jgi:hypothetical protein